MRTVGVGLVVGLAPWARADEVAAAARRQTTRAAVTGSLQISRTPNPYVGRARQRRRRPRPRVRLALAILGGLFVFGMLVWAAFAIFGLGHVAVVDKHCRGREFSCGIAAGVVT